MKKNDLIKNLPYMSPLTERIEALKQKGFSENFEILSANRMIDHDTQDEYLPTEITILKHYRFEGMSDPGDNNILYEMKTSDGKQGILVTPYGSDCPAHVADFVANIPQIEKHHISSATDTTLAVKPIDMTQLATSQQEVE